MSHKQSKEDYISNINIVIDYINNHLDKNISLEELSEVAMFSKYHFHRIFKSIVGENVNAYTKRLRLERALLLLKYYKDYSITEIALSVGFSTNANFSSAFKDYYGVSPSHFKSNPTILMTPLSNTSLTSNIDTISNDAHIRLEWLPEYNVVYLRQTGNYTRLETAWCELLEIAIEMDMINDTSLFIGIPHDDPQFTNEEKLRYDACLMTNQNFTHEKIGHNKILGGLYCIYEFHDNVANINNVYDYIINEWLPKSGYLPDDRKSFELYRKGIITDTNDCLTIDICLPLRKI